MPLDPLSWTVFAAKYVIEKIADKSIEGGVTEGGRKLWTFTLNKLQSKNKTISDKYRELDSKDLLKYYRKENHLRVILDDQEFVPPGALILKPQGFGLVVEQPLQFELKNVKYALPPAVQPFALPVIEEAKKDSRLHDGPVVRLAGLRKMSGSTVVIIQPASYFDAIATNFAMDHVPPGRTESLRDTVHGKQGYLTDYSNSPLVNHIGVVCMIESSDGMLVAQERSSSVANRPNSISASASGTLEWFDMNGPQKESRATLAQIMHGTLRETFKELGAEVKDVYYLGALRDYERGGMPDFYFHAKSNLTLADIIASHKHAEERKESRNILGFEFHSDRISLDSKSRFIFEKRVVDMISEAKTANLTFYVGAILAADNILRRKMNKRYE